MDSADSMQFVVIMAWCTVIYVLGVVLSILWFKWTKRGQGWEKRIREREFTGIGSYVFMWFVTMWDIIRVDC